MRVHRIVTKFYPKQTINKKFGGIVDGIIEEGGELATLADGTAETSPFFAGEPKIPKEERTGNMTPAMETLAVVAALGALAATVFVGVEVITNTPHKIPPAGPEIVTTVPTDTSPTPTGTPYPQPLPTPPSVE